MVTLREGPADFEILRISAVWNLGFLEAQKFVNLESWNSNRNQCASSSGIPHFLLSKAAPAAGSQAGQGPGPDRLVSKCFWLGGVGGEGSGGTAHPFPSPPSSWGVSLALSDLSLCSLALGRERRKSF